MYFFHRSLLFGMMTVFMFFRLLMSIYMAKNKEIVIIQMNELYRATQPGTLEKVFDGAEYGSLAFCMFMCFFGIYALLQNKLTSIFWFNVLMTIQVPLTSLLVYVNVLYVFLLLASLLLWIHVRFLKSLLLQVLIIMQQSEMDQSSGDDANENSDAHANSGTSESP